MVDLKPCPFCGGTDLRLYECNDDSGTWAVACDCEAHGPEVDSLVLSGDHQARTEAAKQLAIELWNARDTVIEWRDAHEYDMEDI